MEKTLTPHPLAVVTGPMSGWPPDATFDGVNVTFRGYRLDSLGEALCAYLGGTFEAAKARPGTAAGFHGRGQILLPGENPVIWQTDLARQDAYVSLMGPAAEHLHRFALLWRLAIDPVNADPSAGVWVSRIDAAVDRYNGTDQYDRLLAFCDSYPPFRGKLKPYGHRDTGRTLYIGNRSSVLYRGYEKGQQMRSQKGVLDAPLDWFRHEVESHPEDAQRVAALTWSPQHVLATSSALAMIFAAHVTGDGITPSFQRSRDSGTRCADVRALTAMARQYGPAFRRLAKRFDSVEMAALTMGSALVNEALQPAELQALILAGVEASRLGTMFPPAWSTKPKEAEGLQAPPSATATV